MHLISSMGLLEKQAVLFLKVLESGQGNQFALLCSSPAELKLESSNDKPS